MITTRRIYKNFLIFLICISLIISYAPAIAFATDDTNSKEIIDSGYCGTYVTYTLYSDGEMVISGTGAMDDIYTGSTHAPWYSNRSKITNVTIENGVTSIGQNIFNSLFNLTEIDIPNSVTAIKKEAFSYCSNLKEITLPETLTTLGSRAFDNCSSLESIIIPENIKGINSFVFSWCRSLKEITLHNNITYISENAFQMCSSLDEIILPDSLTSIGQHAFSDCVALKNITIPDKVQSLTGKPFYNCTSLETITLPNKLTTLEDDTFKGLTGLKTVIFPENCQITSIGNNCFSGCTSLEAISIPKTVTEIGTYAFGGCSNLNSIDIPSNVTIINDGTFKNCSLLTEVTIPAGVNTIGKYAFQNCSGLKSIVIPESITSIKDDAFSYTELLSVHYSGTESKWNSTFDDNNIFNDKTLLHFNCTDINEQVTSYIDSAPTCTNEGVRIYLYSCGASFAETMEKLEHEYEVSHIISPTCTEKGYTEYTCICGDTYKGNYTDLIDHEYTVSHIESPTCTKKGYTEYTCICGDTYKGNYTDLIDHEYTVSHIELPTCTKKGYTEYTCICGDTYKGNYTDLIDHEYTVSHIELPTCTEKGYTAYACICGDTYKGNYTDLIDHEYNDENICNVCGDVKITDPVEKVQISSNEIYIDTVSTLQLNAHVYPYNATIKDVLWTTSDSTIATVSQSGLVASSFKSGKVTIKAIAKDGTDIYDEITLYIGTNHTVAAGNETKFSAKTVYSEVTWEIVNPEILQITGRGYTYASFLDQPYNQYVELKALKSGTTKLYMKNSAGTEVLSTVTITVYTPINEIVADQLSYTIEKGSTYKLDLNIVPDNVDEEYSDIIYTSSNTDILTVDQKGTITGVNNGQANITVRAKLGDASLVIPVSVVTYTDSIVLETNNIELNGNNKHFEIKHKILPEDSTYKSVTYETSDENVALVDSEGKITAIGNGNAIITVTSEDQKAQAEVNVTVTDFITTEDLIIEDKEIIVTTEGKITSYTPKYVLTPENASNKDVLFEIEDPSIAEVDEEGEIKAVSVGETVLTINTKDGRFSDSVPVKVIKGYNDVTYYSVKNDSGKTQYLKSEKVYYGDTIKLYNDLSTKGYYIEGWYQNYNNGFSNRIHNEYIAPGDGTKHYIYINEQKLLMNDIQLENDYEIFADNTVLRVHFRSSTANALYDSIDAKISNENVLSLNDNFTLMCDGNDYCLDFNINGTGKTNIIITTSGGITLNKDITIIDLYEGVEPDNYKIYKVLSDKTAAPKLTAKYINKDQVELSCPSVANNQKLYILENSASTNGKWIHTYGEVANNTHVFKKTYPNQSYKFKGYICETDCDVATKFSDTITYKHTVPSPVFTITNTNHTTNIINIGDNRNDYSNIYIYRSTYSNKNFSKVATIAPGKTSYTNTKLTVGKTYYYKVVGVVNGYLEESATSKVISKKVLPAIPNSLSVTASGSTGAKLKWARVSGANGYRIYRSTSKNGSYKLIKTITKGTTTTFTNTKLTSNKIYYYKINAYVKKSGKSYYSSYCSPVEILTAPKTPTIKLAANDCSSIKVNISNIAGATGYEIYRATSKTGKYTIVATLSTYGTYVDSNLTTGKTYYYKTKAYNSNGSYSTLSGYKSIKVIPPTPSISLTSNVPKQIIVNWNNIEDVTGYQIYRATSSKGKYTRVATISANSELSWTDTKVTKGKKYYYKVRAYVKKGSTTTYGSYSTIKYITAKK